MGKNFDSRLSSILATASLECTHCFMQAITEFHFFLENHADLQFFQTSAAYTNDPPHTRTVWFL